MHDIGTHRAELGDNICSLPVEQHMIYFVSSHSVVMICLLYTSDAADDLLCVDIGGRRIIQKKKKK